MKKILKTCLFLILFNVLNLNSMQENTEKNLSQEGRSISQNIVKDMMHGLTELSEFKEVLEQTWQETISRLEIEQKVKSLTKAKYENLKNFFYSDILPSTTDPKEIKNKILSYLDYKKD